MCDNILNTSLSVIKKPGQCEDCTYLLINTPEWNHCFFFINFVTLFHYKIISLFYWVCVKRIAHCNCRCSSFRFSASFIGNIGEFGAKEYFTDHRTANTLKLFVSIKVILSGLFFFRISCSEGEFPRGY